MDLSNGSAGGQEADAENAQTTKRRLLSSTNVIGIVIFLLLYGGILFGLGMFVSYLQQDAIKYIPVICPSRWIGYEGHCYNFSIEEKTLNESRNMCRLHGAFLAKVTKEEMDFVTNITRAHVFWIDLKREPNQPWKWGDGENATLKVIGNGGNCAYLNDDGTANSGTCSNTHRYICKKELIL